MVKPQFSCHSNNIYDDLNDNCDSKSVATRNKHFPLCLKSVELCKIDIYLR